MKLVFLDSNTVAYQGDVDLAPLSALGDWQQFPTTSPDDTETRVQGADVVICNKVVLNRATLESAPQIKLIAVTATGTNNIDLAAAKQMGMQVCNVSGYSTGSVAQHAIAMMLNLVTNMHQYTAEKRLWAESPIFTRLDHPVGDLAKMTLGIAGAGNIGVRVGEIATSFGMKVQCLHRQGEQGAYILPVRLLPDVVDTRDGLMHPIHLHIYHSQLPLSQPGVGIVIGDPQQPGREPCLCPERLQ